MSKKAILAFSGGLDTSVAVKYLLQEYGLETITVTVDVGQQDDYRKVAAKSKKLGALQKHIHLLISKTEFVTDYIYLFCHTGKRAVSSLQKWQHLCIDHLLQIFHAPYEHSRRFSVSVRT